MSRTCTVVGPHNSFEIGAGKAPAIIAGPCVLESLELGLEIAQTLAPICKRLGLNYIFKASYDKANRTSIGSQRGPGMDVGLSHLAEIRQRLGVPVTTDVHDPEQAASAAEVVDVLQIPAFLCRQTDLLLAAGEAAAEHGRSVNVKKGQFLSPQEMVGPVVKLAQAGCSNVMLTERGTFFGYHRLVNDFIGVADLMELQVQGGSPPVCFDCTHSAQLPGASSTTGGRRERIPVLARAAAAAGVHSIFMECHPQPEKAWSDASTQWPLDRVEELLQSVASVWQAVGLIPGGR